MQARRRGRIVNVSTGAGAWKNLGARTPAYSLSKLGLNGLTRMLAAEPRQRRAGQRGVSGLGGDRHVRRGRAPGRGWRPRHRLAALLPDDGPSGGFFRDGRPIEW
jgi:hypothetical protein